MNKYVHRPWADNSIVALKNIPGVVKKGYVGGHINSKRNLSQKGNCWVDLNAAIRDQARVEGNALILESAQVFDKALVKDNAIISSNAQVGGNSIIGGNVRIGYFCSVTDCILSGDFTLIWANIKSNKDFEIINFKGIPILQYKLAARAFVVLSDQSCAREVYYSHCKFCGSLVNLIEYLKPRYKNITNKEWEVLKTIIGMHEKIQIN